MTVQRRKSRKTGLWFARRRMPYTLAGMLLFVGLASPADHALGQTFNWNADAAGNWNNTTATGWNTGGAYPNAVDHVANFNLNIAGNRAISINVADAMVGSLLLTDQVNSQIWTISSSNAATNKLTFNVTTGSASVTSTGTSNHVISAPVVLMDPLDVAVTGAGSLTISGAITETGSQGITLTQGALSLSGANSFSGAVSISGALTISGGSAIPDASAVTLANLAAASLSVSTSETIGSLAGGGALGGNVILGSRTLSVGSDNTSTTYAGAISGTNGVLTKVGTGMLTLTGTNTYTGATNIDAGTLRISGGTAISDSSNVVLANVAGAVFDLNGSTETVNTLSGGGATGGEVKLGSGGVLTVNANSVTQTYAGTITGTGTLNKLGTHTWVLSGASTFTGDVNVNAGVLNVQHGSALGSAANGTLVASGTSLQVQGGITVAGEPLSLVGVGVSSNGALRNISGDNTWGGAVTLTGATTIQSDAGSLQLTNANSITGTNTNLTLQGSSTGANSITGIIATGSGTLTKAGNSSWTLGGNNTYTGLTTVSAGTLVIGHAHALGTTANGTVVNTNGTLAMQGNITVSGEALSITGTGAGSMGALRNISGSNTWADTVTLASNATIGSDAGLLTLSGTNSVTGATRNLTLSGAGDGLIEGTITTTTGGVTKNDAGTWTLEGNNTYSGAVSVNAGVLNIRHNNALGTTTNGTSVTTGATLELQNNITVTGETLNIRGVGVGSNGALRNISGSNTWAGNVVLDAAAGATIQSDAGLLTISGSIAPNTGNRPLLLQGAGHGLSSGGITLGSGTLTKAGTGVWELSGTNTYTGITTISGGTLALSGSGNISTARLVLDGGVLSLGSNFSRDLSTGAGTFLQFTANGGGFAAYGAPINATTSTANPVWSVTSGFLPAGAPLIFGSNVANNVVTWTGNFSLGSAAGSANREIRVNDNLNSANDWAVISGNISSTTGTYGINKTGDGLLVLSGSLTYTGPTTVTDGTLVVNGTLASGVSPVTVAAGSTLGGTGTINRTITGAGTVDPGMSPGILTVDQVDPSLGMDWNFEFTAPGLPDFTNPSASINDVLRITHATLPFGASLSAANQVNIFLNFAGPHEGVFLGGFYTDRSSDFLTLIQNADFNIYGLDALGSVEYQGNMYSLVDRNFTVSTVNVPGTQFSGANGYITQFNIVPEPTSGALLALGVLVLCKRRVGERV